MDVLMYYETIVCNDYNKDLLNGGSMSNVAARCIMEKKQRKHAQCGQSEQSGDYAWETF